MKFAFRRKPSRPEAMSAFGPKRTSLVAPHMSGSPRVVGYCVPSHISRGDTGGSRKCPTKFYVLSAMAKERPPALLVTAVANGIARYVVVVVKSTHLHQPLPPLQAL